MSRAAIATAPRQRETGNARLRQELAEALGTVHDLKRELASARAKAEGSPASPPLDAATLSSARKVWRLCMDGQTKGEVNAGRARLEEMAARHGMTLAAFVTACGLAKPRVRVKAGWRKRAG